MAGHGRGRRAVAGVSLQAQHARERGLGQRDGGARFGAVGGAGPVGGQARGRATGLTVFGFTAFGEAPFAAMRGGGIIWDESYSDTLSTLDSLIASLTTPVSLSEVVTGIDAITVTSLRAVTLTESLTSLESFINTSSVNLTLSDGIIATDSATITLTSPVISFADTFNVSDNMWLINIPSPTTSIYNPNFIKLPGYNRTVMLNKNKRSIIILPERS